MYIDDDGMIYDKKSVESGNKNPLIIAKINNNKLVKV